MQKSTNERIKINSRLRGMKKRDYISDFENRIK